MNYEFHPLANIFPLIEGQPFDDLVADVKKNGVREPIWMYQHQILDGRNRYRAAKQAGREVEIRSYEGDDAVSFVISLNLHRRHLNESQRSAVAAKLANIQFGTFTANQHVGAANLPTPPVSQAKAAEMLNVSERSVRAATKVIHEGDESLVKAVERGDVAVSAAAKVAQLPKEEQREIVEHGRAKEVAKAARHVGKPKTGPKADAIREEIKAAQERGVSMLCTYARLLLGAIQASESFTDEERELLEEVEGALTSLKGVLHEN